MLLYGVMHRALVTTHCANATAGNKLHSNKLGSDEEQQSQCTQHTFCHKRLGFSVQYKSSAAFDVPYSMQVMCSGLDMVGCTTPIPLIVLKPGCP